MASSTPIDVTVTLEPRDPAGLASYATEVSTPGSSLYRRYLTVAGFRRRFAPTMTQIHAVDASLASHGLAPGTVSANGLAIPVTATAGALGRAFSLSFQRVTLASGRVAFANDQAPRVDVSVAPLIEGVVGLDNLSQAQPLGLARPATGDGHLAVTARVATGGPQPCSTAVSNASKDLVYTANQIASAYRFSSLYGAGDEGAGQTIGLFELEPYASSDVAAYKSCYGTGTLVADVPVDAVVTGTGSGSGEAALDIEDVIGLAPQAKILVYEGPNSPTGVYDTYNAIVSTDRADVISTSWGECESDEGSGAADSENTLFEEADAQGQSVFAAAGDEGSEDCYDDPSSVQPDRSLAVDDPASQPYVTGVGGTSMTALGPLPTQTVWNDNCAGGPCGGGGGVSTLWAMPPYQSGAPSSLNVLNAYSSPGPCAAPSGTDCREVPDVSADADPGTGYLIYYSGGWTGIGGTSAAAPLWAAFAGLVNASSRCDGTTIGFANPVLYKAAASEYSSDFSDIASGENDITASNGGKYPAGPGYDMASGLGTPNGSTLPGALCSSDANLRSSVEPRGHPGRRTSPSGRSGSAPGASPEHRHRSAHAGRGPRPARRRSP